MNKSAGMGKKGDGDDFPSIDVRVMEGTGDYTAKIIDQTILQKLKGGTQQKLRQILLDTNHKVTVQYTNLAVAQVLPEMILEPLSSSNTTGISTRSSRRISNKNNIEEVGHKERENNGNNEDEDEDKDDDRTAKKKTATMTKKMKLWIVTTSSILVAATNRRGIHKKELVVVVQPPLPTRLLLLKEIPMMMIV